MFNESEDFGPFLNRYGPALGVLAFVASASLVISLIVFVVT